MSTPEPNRYAPPAAEVSDAAHAEAMELADRGARFGGAVVDLVISAIVVLPLLVSIGLNFSNWSNLSAASFGGGAALTGLLSLAWVVVTIYLVNKNGQTIGKKLIGTKVVRSDGSRASLGRIFWLRNVVNMLPGMVPLIGSVYPLINHLWIFSEKRQCVHDLIADTIVIKA